VLLSLIFTVIKIRSLLIPTAFSNMSSDKSNLPGKSPAEDTSNMGAKIKTGKRNDGIAPSGEEPSDAGNTPLYTDSPIYLYSHIVQTGLTGRM
jgi:hypothetical protein